MIDKSEVSCIIDTNDMYAVLFYFERIEQESFHIKSVDIYSCNLHDNRGKEEYWCTLKMKSLMLLGSKNPFLPEVDIIFWANFYDDDGDDDVRCSECQADRDNDDDNSEE